MAKILFWCLDLFSRNVFRNLCPLKFSIVPMLTMWVTDRKGDRPSFSRYSDDNKKNTFNNNGNNGHEVQNVKSK